MLELLQLLRSTDVFAEDFELDALLLLQDNNSIRFIDCHCCFYLLVFQTDSLTALLSADRWRGSGMKTWTFFFSNQFLSCISLSNLFFNTAILPRNSLTFSLYSSLLLTFSSLTSLILFKARVIVFLAENGSRSLLFLPLPDDILHFCVCFNFNLCLCSCWSFDLFQKLKIPTFGIEFGLLPHF